MTRYWLIPLFLTGCLLWNCAGQRGPQFDQYDRAGKLLQQKKYNDAIAIYDKVSKESSGTSLGADALFLSAKNRLLYDPRRDYAQALQQFDEFIRLYPNHARAEDAQSWRLATKIMLELKKDNERLTVKIDQLKKIDIRHEQRRGKP